MGALSSPCFNQLTLNVSASCPVLTTSGFPNIAFTKVDLELLILPTIATCIGSRICPSTSFIDRLVFNNHDEEEMMRLQSFKQSAILL